MGLNSKGSDDSKNGRGSGAGSPNGRLSDDSGSASDSESENGIRTGDEFQAQIPTLVEETPSYGNTSHAMLVWAPHPDLGDSKVDEYCQVAKQRYAYNTEQALGMLFWHRHQVEKALSDLANFTPFPDEWTVEDKVLFEQAFGFHGKSFQRIRQMLPDKSIGSLVKYYYSWKKTRARTSLMDRQLRVRNNGGREDTDEEAEVSGQSDAEPEAVKEPEPPVEEKSPPRLGSKRIGEKLSLGPLKKKKPPKGMYLSMEDLMSIATGPVGQGEGILRQLDTEIYNFKRIVQNYKQLVSKYDLDLANGVANFEPPETHQKVNARWTQEEMQLAVQGVRKYGKNFKAIADVVGNKTELHVRSFFVNYRRRYKLDEVYAEYRKDCGGVDNDEDDSKMEQVEETLVYPTSGDAPAATTAPPPLKKTVVTAASQKPGTTVSPAAKPVLQQPPPLIRPTNQKQAVTTSQ